jgi:hypothetical protein
VAITQPDQVWCAGVTNIPMAHGFLYLVAVMDWASRRVLSWRLSNTMEAGFCVGALFEAIEKYGCPSIFNTDQESQFTCAEWMDELKANSIEPLMDGNRVLISSPYDDTNGNEVGQAYLFDTSTGNLLQTLDDPTPTQSPASFAVGDLFGISVALDGNRVLIGAAFDDTNGFGVGQAHLFDATTGDLVQTFDDPRSLIMTNLVFLWPSMAATS